MSPRVVPGPKLDPENVRRGETLKALREARGITIGEFATKLGKSYSHVANVEAGRKRLTPEMAVQSAHLLAVRPAALLRPDEFPEAS